MIGLCKINPNLYSVSRIIVLSISEDSVTGTKVIAMKIYCVEMDDDRPTRLV
jgi:hypothetical protein